MAVRDEKPPGFARSTQQRRQALRRVDRWDGSDSPAARTRARARQSRTPSRAARGRRRLPNRDPGERRGPHRLLARLGIGRVGDSAAQVAVRERERLAAAEVAPRVRALARRACDRRGGRGAARVRPRRVRLERVAQHVHAARRDDARRQRRGRARVDDRLAGPQPWRRDAGLGVVREPVEDRDAGDLAAGAARGGARDVRRERAGHGARPSPSGALVYAASGVPGASRAGWPPCRCRSPSRRRARRSRRGARRARTPRRARTTRRSARSRPRRTRRYRRPRRPATPAARGTTAARAAAGR